MKNKIAICALVFLAFLTTKSYEQTNPTAFDLNANGNYSFTSWPSTSSGYPSNMYFHLMNAANPTVTATAAVNLQSGFVYSNISGTRIQGLGISGIQFQNSNAASTGYLANKLGEAELALVTTSRTQIQLKWTAQTKTTAGNVMAIRCQYRIGTSGTYLEFPTTSEFMSSAVTTDATTFTVNLLPGLENQSTVQIRWIYYRVSVVGTGAISRTIRLDDISVTSIPSVSLSQHPDVCINEAPFTITDGFPAGGVYSGLGVTSGTTFDPGVHGVGTSPLTYTVTDANLISNSATVSITESASACVVPIGLASASCGATGLMKNSNIFCESAFGAQDYEYEFSGGDLTATILKKRNYAYTSFPLSYISQLNYGQTYNVRVRAKIANIWGTFANTCTISLAAVSPVPQLTASTCGATGLTLTSYVYTTAITNAQDYEYQFVNASLGYTGTKTRGNYYADMNLAWVSGLKYGYTYDVRVRSLVNNVWGAFGPMCQITLQAFPATQLTVASCGATNLVKASKIYCNAVPGATNYEYRFTPLPSGTPVTKLRNANTNDFYLSYVTSLLPSTSYNVEVRALAGGVWGTFATVCQISTSATYSALAPLDLSQNSVTREMDVQQDSPLLISMYPNPVTDNTLHLEISGYNSSCNIATVDIFDLSGRLTSTQFVTLASGSSVIDLNVESIESGLYFVSITVGEQKITQRLIVKK